MAAGNARITRYVLLTLVFATLLWFFSSSSIPEETVAKGGQRLADWKNRKNKPQQEGQDNLSPVTGESSASPNEVSSGTVAAPDTGVTYPNINDNGAGSSPALAGGSASSQSAAPADTSSSPNTAHDSPLVSHSGSSSHSGKMTNKDKVNATFVTLARNSDLWDIVDSIRGIEDRFNHKYGYDWVFLNDKPFDEEFKKTTTALISGKARYGLIGEEHWSFPEWIDQSKAQKVREDMAERKIIYGDSVSYRHMCRFESGFFFQQPLLQEYEWYWRVEPSVKIFCDINYDPFQYMVDNKKKYSFVLSLYEYAETIPTIWDSTKKFIREHPEHIATDNSMKWLSDDHGETYNHCHFWSNFEIGNLNWLRSSAYMDFFETLDKDGGFFYERWGDAPVHSIAAGLLLNRDEIHFFEDIGYWHVPFTHCPTDEKKRLENKCHCNPKDNFDWKGYSCTTKWFDMNKLEKPDGWKEQAE